MKKSIFSDKSVRVWMLATSCIIVLFTVINFLALNVFYSLFNIVMPGGGLRAVYAEGVEPIYTTEFTSKQEALDNGNKVNLEVCEEGFVLLKNDNNALPLYTKKSKENTAKEAPSISVFGKNSVNLAYGGSGSGTVDSTQAIDLYTALEEAGYNVNPVLKNFYKDTKQSGPKREANSSDLDSGKTVSVATAETPQSKYTDAVKSSYAQYNDAAIVVFTRIGGEGFDLPRTMKGAEGARSDDDTYLQLDANETALLEAVCNENFKRVIVLINSAAAMELTFLTDPTYYAYQSKIDAAIWMGFPGVSGATALGSILNGNVNPSGRTVDTYAANLKAAPSFANFGDNNQTNGDRYSLAGKQYYYFVDYEESIYVGYRYYETRGYTDGEEWYKENVVYPFGYGQSYTDFTWELIDDSSIKNKNIMMGGKYTLDIKVTNTGSHSGKEVVQLYGNAPYYEGGIEKAHVVLLDFVKTEEIEPGESDVVTLTFDPYYLASYDYKDSNKNDFYGYELEAGSYNLFVSYNAHDTVFKIPFTVVDEDGILIDVDPTTNNSVENRYTNCENVNFNSDTHLGQLLSRADWNGTWPVAPTDADRLIDRSFIYAVEDMTHNNPYAEEYDAEDMPDSEMEYGLTLRDFLVKDETGVWKVDYDDIRWEQLLDQCSIAEMIALYNEGAFQTIQIDTIGKPKTNDTDGPAGFINFMDTSTFYGTCSYCAEVVMASTWNVELIEKLGVAVGNEGIWGNEKGDKMPYSGWYAPGVNIHRSPFGGRNFEYFSEDGLLNGKMAAAEIRGCQSKGVYCFVKHFALNEQETHRSLGGDMSWVTEQSMREIYLRPFELAVKEGGTRAMMSSFNRIGTRWTGGDYRLLTEILRDEWGFKGTVICDFNTHPEYMDSRQMAYAGGDLNLATLPKTWTDESSVADVIVLRQCVKNILYTVVNSNAFNGTIIGFKLPYWHIGLIALDCVIAVGLLIWGGVVIVKASKKPKQLKKRRR